MRLECRFAKHTCYRGHRLVWNRIWAVLSDFFVEVGCHRNLQVLQRYTRLFVCQRALYGALHIITLLPWFSASTGQSPGAKCTPCCTGALLLGRYLPRLAGRSGVRPAVRTTCLAGPLLKSTATAPFLLLQRYVSGYGWL